MQTLHGCAEVLVKSLYLVFPGPSDTLTALILMTLLTWDPAEVSCYLFPCSHHSGPKLCLDMPFSSTSQLCNAFYLPSKEAFFHHISHFKGPVEGCSSPLCARQGENVLDFCRQWLKAWRKFLYPETFLLTLRQRLNPWSIYQTVSFFPV